MYIVPTLPIQRINSREIALQDRLDYALKGIPLGQAEGSTLYDETATLFKRWFPTVALVGVTVFVVAISWSLIKKFK